MIQDNTILFAFGLTLFAGLSTGIGSALAFFAKRTNTNLLSIALGFSAGVMIYVSFMEILVESQEAMVRYFGGPHGTWVAAAAFFGGIICIALIDKLIPSFENPHEIHVAEEMNNQKMAKRFKKLHHIGIFTACAIAIHNFPEGLVTFIGALSDPALGIALAFAIAIHNIPEGIAVAIPIYYGTGSRKKAFIYSFLSGLAEPLGALLGFFILMKFMNDLVFGVMFGVAAGIMVFISLDELLPAAQKHGEHHHSIYGLIAGMAVMAFSLLLFI
jgi:ZIP family zinc transporter